MKKLLYIPHPHATEEKESFYHSFQKKYDCNFYNHNGGTYILPTGFDIIYIHAGSLHPDTFSTIKEANPKSVTIQWGGDCREGIVPDFIRLKGLIDITFLACGMGAQKEMYEKEIGKVEWLTHGVADWQFKEVNPNAKGIVFIGNHYGEFSGDIARYEICKKLKEVYGDEFKIYGNGFGDLSEGTIPFEQTPEIYNKALVSIDGSIFHDKDGYFSNRPLCAMAAGSVCAIRAFPLVRKCFPFHWTWDTFDHLKDKIDWLKSNKEARTFLALQQQNYVRGRYHYDNLVETIESYL